MKRHHIAQTAGLAILALLFLGTSVAMANITTANTTDIAETTVGRFQTIALELPEMETNDMPALQFLSNENLGKILEEKTEFRKEAGPLVHQLKSKWIALADELEKQSPEETTTTQLQDEISVMCTRLAEMRFEHFLALQEIKTNAVN